LKSLIHPLNQQHENSYTVRNRPAQNLGFNNHPFATQLKEAINQGKLKVSKHAQIRMEQRKIDISPSKWKQIEEKVSEAKVRGIKEPLVILKEAALIVSAKNDTVITMMDRKEASNQIFSNIDGTIILD